MATQRWALLLQYDGSDFAGSQRQPDRPTVQGALESALVELTGSETRVSLAGRTDAGVHATGQVASFLTSRSVEEMAGRRWVRGINHFLPTSVAAQAAAPVAISFDPRRDAIARQYRYLVRLADQRQPLWEDRAWTVRRTVSAELARAGLEVLHGGHDFAAFTPPTADRSTWRTLDEALLNVSEDGLTWQFTFVAQSFLQHQVRRMMGAIVDVARGHRSVDQLQQLLDEARPGSAGPTAPASGLTLAAIVYDSPVFDCRNHPL